MNSVRMFNRFLCKYSLSPFHRGRTFYEADVTRSSVFRFNFLARILELVYDLKLFSNACVGV